MKRYFRVPGDTLLPGRLFSDERFPGMHVGEHDIIILTGPERIFGAYGLGHIPAQHMQFVLVRYARHGETRKHIHPDQVQLYYVVSGRATVAIDRSEIVLGPGCFAHIPPDEPHGFRNEADEPLLLLDVHSYCFGNEAPTTLSLETLAIEPGARRTAPSTAIGRSPISGSTAKARPALPTRRWRSARTASSSCRAAPPAAWRRTGAWRSGCSPSRAFPTPRPHRGRAKRCRPYRR